MTKRMLIDSTHAEETRVVVLDGNRLEDYDIETAAKQQLKGNIYLAKIVRVEPSLQAAFVEFGGGRHGFLAFGEIHPDYYQIPVADRKRLLEAQEAEAIEAEEEEEREVARERGRGRRRGGSGRDAAQDPSQDASEASAGTDEADAGTDDGEDDVDAAAADAVTEAGYATQADPEAAEEALPRPDQVAQAAAVSQDILVAPEEAHALFADPAATPSSDAEAAIAAPSEAGSEPGDLFPSHADAGDTPTADDEAAELSAHPQPRDGDTAAEDTAAEDDAQPAELSPPPEQVGGENETDERPDRRTTPRFLRNYKIQEVIRRRQILLVQVVKEERGTKGAALTTYISLAGRFSVLMPNSPRGGGISRKITSAADRRRLKEITAELELPRGMGLIVRTAGANRPKPEILRDCEYLLDQWDQVRELTMKSMAPALIYEEASLIKRAIRDVYSRDVDDILVDGETGWRAARDFMRMLMPTHARKVQLWKDPQPLFAKAQVESQLDAILQPNVQLRSGGYLVINQTEALVAIDVNSGRSTRERGIEETALRTNLEAAEEAARQLRLRDLAGLIVIDFIDMESRRNNAAVERKLKDALKDDRARIQIGSISHFGLLEMSRQRLRPSLAETNFVICPHCNGTGHVRGTESAALHVLRGIEEEGAKRRAAEIVVHVAGAIALYILNHKRARLAEIEARFGLHVTFEADETLLAPDSRIERVRAQTASELPPPVSQLAPPEPFEDPDEELPLPEAEAAEEAGEADEADAATPETAAEAADGDRPKRRRRRRRGGARREDGEDGEAGTPDGDMQVSTGDTEDDAAATDDLPATAVEAVTGIAAEAAPGSETDPDAAATAEDGERKRRGRRGGRRRRRDADGTAEPVAPEAEDAPPPTVAYAPAPYRGPTPADPFGGANAFDFFDAIEEAEQARVTPGANESTRMAAVPEAAQPAPVTTAPDPDAERSFESETPVTLPEAPRPEASAPEVTTPEVTTPEVRISAPVTHAPDPEAEQSLEPGATATAPEPVTYAPDPEAEQSLAAGEPEPAPSAGPVIGAAVAPVLIGTPGAEQAEKRRGWWRR